MLIAKKNVFYFSLLIWTKLIIAQPDSLQEKTEVFLIDSYITPELPHTFVISFFTSDSSKSFVVLNGRYEYEVSKNFTMDHKTKILVDSLKLLSPTIAYKIKLIDKKGRVSFSENYEVKIPSSSILKSKDQPSIFTVCCFGGVIFGLPSPTYLFENGKGYLSLTKEIPLFSFYSVGYNYPVGYISAEYAYVFNYERKNFVRLGYKQIFQVPKIQYISFGINYFSDLTGYNGVSPEFSLGLLRIYNVFTLFLRYRHNFYFKDKANNFHEFTVGLYSNFFSINF
ncbi:hypothetical protein ABRY23_08025 [Melioribacteraceae bacterium 4301-Me]|uniref:hypothetical protein n=1 Tax=Pyranulibacter aquaticus TaxID=3163344 RepID=UPI003599D956